jgi:uncharacterized iron-regulated protein
MYEGPGFLIVNPRVGTKLRQEAFEQAVSAARIVYAGESSGQLKDHLAQLEILKMMSRMRKGRVVVGLEMLPRSGQPALDAYLAGTLTEEAFLSGTDWNKSWGHDFSLYRPLLDFMRENRLKGAALGLPRALTAKLARGNAAELESAEKALLPAKIPVISDKAYLDYLRGAYKAGGAAGRIKWDDYLYSVSAGNEAAGARITEFLKKYPESAFLTLAGNGRFLYNAGIPAAVRSRLPAAVQISVCTRDAADLDDFLKHPLQLADYVWFISRPAKDLP